MSFIVDNSTNIHETDTKNPTFGPVENGVVIDTLNQTYTKSKYTTIEILFFVLYYSSLN